jgi:N-acetylmuramoyl-L-alanine amidase
MTSCQESRRGLRAIQIPDHLDVGHTAETPGAKSASLISIWGWRSGSRKLKSDGVAETLLVTEGKRNPACSSVRLPSNWFLSIHHDAVPDSFFEEWKFEGKKNHFRDRFSRYLIFVCLENRKFMAP